MVLALVLAVSVYAEDVEIQFEQLPEKAQKAVLKAFPDTRIKKVEMERRASSPRRETLRSASVPREAFRRCLSRKR